MLYRPADDSVVAERNVAEVGRLLSDYFEQRDGLEAVTRVELLERLASDLVTVLDVRPADEFALGHIPGARNVPLAELEQALATLAPERTVVAYCRGPYCVLSFEAVALLRARGYAARRLEDGLPEWRAAGLPTVVGA